MLYAWITQIGEKWIANITAHLTRPPAVHGFSTAQEAVDWIEEEAREVGATVEWVKQ